MTCGHLYTNRIQIIMFTELLPYEYLSTTVRVLVGSVGGQSAPAVAKFTVVGVSLPSGQAPRDGVLYLIDLPATLQSRFATVESWPA